MKLKLDDQGRVVLQDGMPVYVHDDGKEAPFDAAATVAAIRARNAEAKALRERAEAAEKAAKAFEGLDPEAARDAVAKLEKLDLKKLVDAGQVDQIKAEINKAWEAKLSDAEKRAQTVERQLHDEIVGGSFARSKFIADKLAIPVEFVQAAFGSRFKVEDGKLKAYDADGNVVYSRQNPGQPAAFDEAMEHFVNGHAHKASILKATQGGGSGAPAGSGTGGGPAGAKTITRAEFEKLDSIARTKHFHEGGTVVDQAA